MADGCCDRHRLTWDDDGCGPLTRELLAAVLATARALHSDAINTNNPKHVEITRTMIGLCELLAERMPINGRCDGLNSQPPPPPAPTAEP